MYLIGYVLKPQGIRGEIKINPLSDNPERFRQLDTILININQVTQTYTVRQVRMDNRFVYLRLLGVETREEAAALRGGEVLIGEKNLHRPAENEFFIHDLVGCQVFSEEGSLIGRLSEVLQLTSNDIWVIIDEAKKEILIPAIQDVIRQVDVEHKKITINVLEGLLD
jgi:16S rRNA processing protein RimM